MEFIFVIFSVWLMVAVIKAILKGLKWLFSGPRKKPEEGKKTQAKPNSQTKKSPSAAAKTTGQNTKPKAAPKTPEPAKAAPKTPESAKAAPKTPEPAKAAPKTPEPAKAAPKEPEPVKKPAPEKKKTPTQVPRENLPPCCARCGGVLTAPQCTACGFDHSKTPVIYLCHPRFSP